VSGQGHA